MDSIKNVKITSHAWNKLYDIQSKQEKDKNKRGIKKGKKKVTMLCKSSTQHLAGLLSLLLMIRDQIFIAELSFYAGWSGTSCLSEGPITVLLARVHYIGGRNHYHSVQNTEAQIQQQTSGGNPPIIQGSSHPRIKMLRWQIFLISDMTKNLQPQPTQTNQ